MRRASHRVLVAPDRSRRHSVLFGFIVAQQMATDSEICLDGVETLGSFDNHIHHVKTVAYNSLDGSFVSLDAAGLRLWDLEKGELRRLIYGGSVTSFLISIIFVPSKSVYVASALDGSLKVRGYCGG